MSIASYTFADGALQGDPLSILDGGDELGTLAQAILISLLSWRRANDDDALPVPGERQGWWADAFNADGDRFGSRLWLLGRGTITADTANRAREYAAEALAWLVADGLAASVDVQAERQGDVLALGVTAIRDDGRGVVLTFADLWEALDA